MRNRATRIALALILAVGLTAAGYQIVTLERRQVSVAAAHDGFEGLAVSVGSRLNSLQTAQQAYVAAGQGLEFWMQQASSILDGLSLDLVELKRLSSTQESATAVGVVSQTIDNFIQLDERVRDYATNGQVLMASDIIFTDGIEMLQGATESLTVARDDERRRAVGLRQEAEGGQMMMVAGAGAGSLLIALLLLVTGTGAASEPTSSEAGSAEASEPLAHDHVGLSLGPIRPEHGPDVGAAGDALTGAAALCADLARVQDATDLPPLLERSVKVLDGSGLIVWLTGHGDEPLRPILTHGYSAETVRRIGSIRRDADNATAAAFRDASLQTVAGDDATSGAIVAPLVTGRGCIGLLAVEIPPGVALDETRQSVARILASQLALLLAEQPAGESQRRHEGEVQAQAQG